jgi:hypothetical protein
VWGGREEEERVGCGEKNKVERESGDERKIWTADFIFDG